MHKTLTALAVAAAMTFAVVAAPDQAEARWRGRNVGPGILGGLAAGLIIGSIAASRGDYYGPGYYGPGYYGPGYYEPGPYAYEAAPIYVVPAPVYVAPPRAYYRGGSCWITTDDARGFGYYGPCR